MNYLKLNIVVVNCKDGNIILEDDIGLLKIDELINLMIERKITTYIVYFKIIECDGLSAKELETINICLRALCEFGRCFTGETEEFNIKRFNLLLELLYLSIKNLFKTETKDEINGKNVDNEA